MAETNGARVSHRGVQGFGGGESAGAAAAVRLSEHTTLGLGGPARRFVTARDDRTLTGEVAAADARGESVFVLGGGSNVVVADAGFAGLVVRVATRGLTVSREGDVALVDVAAGEPWDDVVAWSVAQGFAGLECLSGIPGLTGATPIQNVGAYGQEVSQTLRSVTVYDRVDGVTRTMPAAACAFGYRDSAFKGALRGRCLVRSARFALRVGGAPSVRYAELARAVGPSPSLAAVRDAVLTLRRAKSMVLDARDPDTRSAGSFFTNPVVTAAQADEVERRARSRGALREGASMPRFDADGGRVKLAAAWLIERAGVERGLTRDGVGVSSRHALALVNRGGTATALLALARSVRAAVRDAWGVSLTPEPEFVGFDVADPCAP